MIISELRQRRIYWIAHVLRWLATGAIAAVAVMALYPLVQHTGEWTVLPGVVARMEPPTEFAADYRMASWLGILPGAVLIYGLFQLRSMLRLYESGELFSAQVPTHLQYFSSAIVAVELLHISLPLQIAAAQWAIAGTHHAIKLVVTSEELWLLLLAGLFMTLAFVMREAAAVADDSASII